VTPMNTALAALAVGMALTVPGLSWRPSPKLVAEVERDVALPARAKPLASYHRTYWGAYDLKGARVVRAHIFRLTPRDRPGVEILGHPDQHEVMDGGCSFINLTYDVEAHRITQLSCNGYA
jgi:hypothetical protein